MPWERSPLSDLVVWCAACARAFDPATGAPVARPARIPESSLPSGAACPSCGAPLTLQSILPALASNATVVDRRTPSAPSQATLIESPATGHPPRAGNAGATSRTANAAIGDLSQASMAPIGPFRILRELGRGGMGIVYLAEDPDLGRRCALKVLPLTGEAANDPEWVERFEREARATAQLGHPNLVAVHSVGATPGCRYIAMDYVPGRSLDEVFRVEGMTPERAIRIVWQASLGLAHSHENGVVHRDIKPSNLLVEPVPFTGSEMRLSRRERGAMEAAARCHGPAARRRPDEAEEGTSPGALIEDVVRVTDFGLAVSTRSHRLTVEGAILGTPTYMSPEQTLGRSGDATPQMDVYGLGATLYELLTGAPPFSAPGTAGLFYLIQETEPVPPRRINPNLDRDIETVVLKCLDKDPAKRYADARELADDLRRWLDDEPVLARRPSRVDVWKRKFRRSPAQYVLGTALGFLLLSLAGYGIGDVVLRHLRFDETIAAATAALDAGDLAGARKRLDAAAGFLPARPETALIGEQIDRQQAVLRAVAAGKKHLEEWRRAREETAAREAERRGAAGALADRAGVVARKAVWDAEAAAAAARDRARAAREASASHLAAALELDPQRAEARALLADLAWAQFRAAEDAGDAAELARWETLLRAVDGAGAERRLAEPSRVKIDAEGGAARVSVLRYVEVGRLSLLRPPGEPPLDEARRTEALARFEPDAYGRTLPSVAERAARSAFFGPGVLPAELGRTPIEPALPPGSYLFLIERDGRTPARLPVRLNREARLDRTMTLLPSGSVPDGFVHVPAGPFLREDSAAETTTGTYCIARFEVTNTEYLEFLNDPGTQAEVARAEGGIRRVPRTAPRDGALWPRDPEGRFSLPDGLREDAPVTGVDLDDARAYAAWFDRRRGDAAWTFALPTEPEWEKAMRGTDGRPYPWGNAFDSSLCAVKGSSPGRPAPVGAFPADESPFGARDMAGNAAEWTVTGDDRGGYAVKGGSWTSDSNWCRADSRDLDLPGEVDDENGIRLVARPRNE